MTKIIDIKIRKIQKKDQKEVLRISKESFPDDEADFITQSLFDREHFYIAEIPDKIIVGFICFGIYSVKAAHIMILAVDPKYQRKSIGTKLLMFAIKIMKKHPISKIRLEVKVSNVEAIEFYEKHEFKIAGVIDKYYDDQSDAYLMILDVKEE